MSDEPKKRSRVWIGWAPLAAGFLHAFTVAPSDALRWLCRYEVVAKGGFVYQSVGDFYAPVEWLARTNRHVYGMIGEIIERLDEVANVALNSPAKREQAWDVYHYSIAKEQHVRKVYVCR